MPEKTVNNYYNCNFGVPFPVIVKEKGEEKSELSEKDVIEEVSEITGIEIETVEAILRTATSIVVRGKR